MLGHRAELIASISTDETRRYGLVADNMRSMEGNRASKHLRMYFEFKEAFYKGYVSRTRTKLLFGQGEGGRRRV